MQDSQYVGKLLSLVAGVAALAVVAGFSAPGRSQRANVLSAAPLFAVVSPTPYFVAPPPAKLAFINVSNPIPLNTCSPPVKVQAQDQYSNPANIVAPELVNISVPGVITVYSDWKCLNSISSITIPAGSTAASFYVKSSPGASSDYVDIDVWSAHFPTVVVQGVTLGTDPKGHFDGVVNGVLSGWTCDADNYSAGLSVYLYYDSGRMNLLQSGNVSADQPAGATSTVATQCGGNQYHKFSYTIPAFLKDGKSHSLYAEVGDLNNSVGYDRRLMLTGSATYQSARPTGTAKPTKLAFINTPNPIPLNICSPAVKVQVQDQYGNPINVANSQKLSISGASDIVLYADAKCTSSISFTTIAAGSNTVAFYYKPIATAASDSIELDVWTSSLPVSSQEERFGVAPKGHLDGVVNGVLSGWTCDADNYSAGLSVYLYYDSAMMNLAGSSNVAADQAGNATTASQCGGNANHKFSYPIPSVLADGKPHSLYAQVVDLGSPLGADVRYIVPGSPVRY